MGTENDGFEEEPAGLADALGIPVTPPSAAESQVFVARAALRRLALNDEMAGMGQRDGDPEAIARCRYAAGALETMDRLAQPVPPGAAGVRDEVLAGITGDWTIDPSTGRSNSSEAFRAMAAEVGRLLRSEFRVVDATVIARAAALIVAQLAHVHRLAPAAGGTVGDVRALLAAHGIPHADATHYVVAATWPPAGMAVINCCDSLDDSVMLLQAATASLGGDVVPAGQAGRVVVSREDLRIALDYARHYDVDDDPAMIHLTAAAEEGQDS
jgi:hypothetical protein